MPAITKRSRGKIIKKLTHCASCDVSLTLSCCSIDWEEVWKKKFGQDADVTSDMCDDCCCGACGLRKRQKGNILTCCD